MEPTYRLTRQQLYDLVWSRPLSALAAEFKISGGGLAKICDRLMVPHPPRGYWSGASARRTAVPPPLPPRPEDCAPDVVISAERAPSRRSRTRLPLAARRDQIADAAAKLIMQDGLHAATMKRVAWSVGISEAQAYNHFANQLELLAYIARREQADLDATLQGAIDTESEYNRQARKSFSAYLRYIARSGSLLQTLLGSAELRGVLREEHHTRREWISQTTAEGMAAADGIPAHLAVPGTMMLTAIVVRAGHLLGRGKAPVEEIERLADTMMEGARARLRALSAADRSVPRAGAPALRP
ncbi:TetR/AcrR family transcriptional regulator [Phenylobacterium sp.]|uniref:TetR/AcrR family transcriptional regulator n=1 Tax=Phenylobacterium sp. TaxID=1871053 RepID=UPI0025E52E7A|nr:TetR/AcrR family transcriptional regulator [Phenylobacterium sp.]